MLRIDDKNVNLGKEILKVKKQNDRHWYFCVITDTAANWLQIFLYAKGW